MEDIKQLYAQKLQSLSPNITAEDKVNVVETLPISRPTLDNYLSGDIDKIKKLETAKELIEFFTKRIQKRINELRATNLV